MIWIDNFESRADAELVEAWALSLGDNVYIRNWHGQVKGWYVIRYSDYTRVGIMAVTLKALKEKHGERR